MDFLLGIVLTIGVSILAAIALMAWAHRSPNASIPEPAPQLEATVLGQCSCDDCAQAVQPVQLVQVGLAMHLVQRDTFHHEYSGDCVCGPQLAFNGSGPMLIHTPLEPAQ